MNKSFFAIVVVVLLAAGCNASVSQSDNPTPDSPTSHSQAQPGLTPMATDQSLETYNNQKLGFELRYPSDWSVENVQALNSDANNNGLLTGVFAISKTLTTTDQYGEEMTETALFSIAVVNIPTSLPGGQRQLPAPANYMLGERVAVRNIQDGPDTIYTTVHVVANGRLLRINYTWSGVVDGRRDSHLTATKAGMLDTFTRILGSFN
jgi:hypothetical protein